MIKKTTKKETVKKEGVKKLAAVKAAKKVLTSSEPRISRFHREPSILSELDRSIEKKKDVLKARYIEAVGRRKTSVARVRLISEDSGIKINEKDYKDYFKMPKLQEIVSAPLIILELKNKYGFTVVVGGGGIFSQAEAIRHGITRALIKLNAEFRKRLKKYGFITRDSRMVERKKYGLKKARKAPQWAKR